MNKQKLIGHIMVATGLTIPAWAKSKGYSKVAVYAAINGDYVKSKIKQDICRTIRMSENEIWPEAQGERK